MIKYFRDLLATLKSIDENLKKIERNTKMVSDCVRKNHHSHGDQASLSTKHWNGG
jgi:hypothetical protein